jgi:carboxyl-terminal processing protease
MKKSVKAYFFSLFVFLFPFFIHAQTDYCADQKKLLGVIKKFHYAPPSFNADVNLEVLDLLLNKLDPKRIYFLQTDVQNFKELIKATPDENVFCPLFGAVWSAYKIRLRQTDSLLNILAGAPLDYLAKDTIYINPNKKAEWVSSSIEMKKRLEKRIKASVLFQILKPKEEGSGLSTITPAKLKTSEPEERKIVITKEKRKYTAILADENKLKEHVFVELNDAICKRCDPHSDYFTLKDKESFEGSLSSEEMSYGFTVTDNNDGEIIIAHLVPGSSAWRCNSLHEGDVIIRIKWPDKAAVDISNMDTDEFYELMKATAPPKMQLTVRKKDNEVKTVALEKTKVESEENTLNSFVLSDDSTKLGYIPLPSFYTDFDEEGNLGCANDVAKEIIKLKAENIQGLILDLRYNGGGSMKEAMDLAGIFIDEGPLAIFRGKKDKPYALKDLNRGTMYDGPLVVLINNYSASASEFFSAAVQDYNRALIVGSSTYGKATAQNVLPADTNLLYYKNKKNITSGYSKITMNKFYRVTGISHQSSGIKPDITLPDLLNHISVMEKEMPFAFKADSVNKKIIFKPYLPLPKEALKNKSAQRVNASTRFTSVKQLEGDVEKIWHSEYKMPVTFEGAKKYLTYLNEVKGKVDKIAADTLQSGLKVENNNFSKDLMNYSDYRKEQNKKLTSNLAGDIYIKECFLILKDLNIFNKN